MKEHYLYDNYLRENAKALAWRSLAGMPNIILIFGPTRWGKSTLAFCLAKEISEVCKVPFTVDNIDFDAEILVSEASNGKKHHVYVLDEGAFQLKGEDWQNKASKILRKFFNTAAMYNQTFIICIPFIGELHKAFIKDEHACGFRVHAKLNRKADKPEDMYKKGFVKAYKKYLYAQWKGEKDNVHHSTLWKYASDVPICKFPKDISFIDEDKYQEKKKAAIKKLADDESASDKSHQRKAGLLAKYVHKEQKLSYQKIGEIIGSHENTVGRLIRAVK
jgi:hypothetical protein